MIPALGKALVSLTCTSLRTQLTDFKFWLPKYLDIPYSPSFDTSSSVAHSTVT